MERRGLAAATRAAYGRVARSYLVFLEGRGIAELGGADGASVLAFLASLLGKWAKSSLFWLVSNFRPFLKFTGRSDLVDALNLAGVKRSHAIIPVLGDADEELVVEACASGAVSARDAAITLLALTTGLRACDIVGMRTGDIDWRGRTIGIVQQKTGNPLTLPLPALVAAKLADYVLGERPCSGDDHLFLRSVAPHTRLTDHASVHSRAVCRLSGGDGGEAQEVMHGKGPRKRVTNEVNSVVAELTYSDSGSMTHAMGHRMQDRNREISVATKALLRVRTEGLPFQRYHPSELVVQDDFAHQYIGKDYPGGHHTEVFSCAMEALTHGRFGGQRGPAGVDLTAPGGVSAAERMQPSRTDPEHLALVLGLLASANKCVT